jgi:hypothetical protein
MSGLSPRAAAGTALLLKRGSMKGDRGDLLGSPI